jgi:hypothetical protein
MPLHKDLREFVELLNSNAVDYLVVGALAVSFHGYPRYTADLDVLVRPEPLNAQKMLSVFSQFGFGSLDIQADDLQKADNVIQLGVHPNRIDLLTTISGVSFEEAWTARVETEFEGLPIRFIGIAELIRNKESIGRVRDLGDAEELRKVLKLKTR